MMTIAIMTKSSISELEDINGDSRSITGHWSPLHSTETLIGHHDEDRHGL